MENQNNSRRSFIRKAVVGGVAAFTIPEILSASIGESASKRVQLTKNSVVLFQGDSITDAGRNKEDQGYNTSKILGTGYAFLAAANLLNKFAAFDLKVFNRGISGNKVYQLAERWDKDCLDLKPDVLSILIGVNDFWHKLNGNYNGTIDIYKKDFASLLERTMKALPNVRLIIGEPFAVPGIKAVDGKWYPEFYAYQTAAREIANSFGTVLIPYQKIFDEAKKQAPGVYWTADGVHPTLAGAQLMAEALLKTIK